jgi:hypothetical protein
MRDFTSDPYGSERRAARVPTTLRIEGALVARLRALHPALHQGELGAVQTTHLLGAKLQAPVGLLHAMILSR